jgi:two-component system, LytTR family, sensor kinase
MKAAVDRRFALYSSLFITLALNLPKLLALRKDGVVAHFWHFDLTEMICEMLLNYGFCLAIFLFNQPRVEVYFKPWRWALQGLYLGVNLLLLGGFTTVSIVLQRLFFLPGFLFGGGNGFRFTLSLILAAIELRIYFLVARSRDREMENEHLRNAYLKAELEVLKGQLNPHFFFNALSSLSAVVRENPPLAQQYISHLSKFFRYSLERPDRNIVPLADELVALQSYVQLMKMRYEEGFHIHVDVSEADARLQVPHMSLQPLVENALKHNQPALTIHISARDGILEVRNNIRPTPFGSPGTGIGLANLNERFKILCQREIEVIRTPDTFVVKLPLL